MDGRARLTLLTPAPTAAAAAAAFPADEPLDDRGRAWLGDVRVPRATWSAGAPDRACRETAAALGVAPEIDERVRGWDLGAWAGRTLDDLAARRPDDVAAWLADPAAAPHGGESLTAFLARVRAFLKDAAPGHGLVVCPAAVARAAVVVVLEAPTTAFWRVDAAPLTVTDLRGGPARWTVRATGARTR